MYKKKLRGDTSVLRRGEESVEPHQQESDEVTEGTHTSTFVPLSALTKATAPHPEPTTTTRDLVRKTSTRD